MINMRLQLIIVLAVLLSGCWEQEDKVVIDADGTTEFKSDIVITEKGFSKAEIEQLSREFEKELTSAGWSVERRWVSERKPFRLQYTGTGNLKNIRSAPNLYKIVNIDDNIFEIAFIPAEVKAGKSTRRIAFEFESKFLGVFGGSSRMEDENGNQVDEIKNVYKSDSYTIYLEQE